ncbi:MAG: nitroreductase family protein [Chloroflexi bacterium]|nr:nitroreductase family protein [Chloroflexota bacterium]
MDVFETIKNRKSIRKYRTTPVGEKTVETLFEAVRLTPSWANTQCWRFVVVRDNSIKAQMADTLTPTNPSGTAIRNAPVVIVACAELGKSGYKRGEVQTDKGDWFMFDVGLAMESLTLVAHALGLGTVHVGLFDARKAAEVLSVPDGFCVVEMTPLGYPDETPPARPRKDLSEIVFYEKWPQ